MKYNIVVCCYDKMLVNVATYVIPGEMCVWCGAEQTGTGHFVIMAHY